MKDNEYVQHPSRPLAPALKSLKQKQENNLNNFNLQLNALKFWQNII
jgi:hypothetical protein